MLQHGAKNMSFKRSDRIVKQIIELRFLLGKGQANESFYIFLDLEALKNRPDQTQ